MSTRSRAIEDQNRRLLRARDAMDRTFAEPLDIGALARIAHVSEGHFIRTFAAIVGESPTRHRQRGPVPPVPGCFVMAWTRPSVDRAVLDKQPGLDSP